MSRRTLMVRRCKQGITCTALIRRWVAVGLNMLMSVAVAFCILGAIGLVLTWGKR